MKEDRVYLQHIRDAIDKIFRYAKGEKEEFLSDDKSQDAIIRNLEIIGEAVKNVSASFREKYPNIPWKQIAGMRDEMIHEYFGVDLDIVWNVVEKDLPTFKAALDNILSRQSEMPVKPTNTESQSSTHEKK